MMFQSYGKRDGNYDKKIICTVNRSKRSGIHKLGVLEGKNRDDVQVISKCSKKVLKCC